MRAFGTPTTPEDLKARGVARLRSVNLTQMAALIEKAVNRTLIARTLGKLDDGVDSFSHATRNEFIDMLRRGEKAPDSVEEQAESELDRLKRELHKRRIEEKARRETRAAEPQAEPVELERDRDTEEEIRALFAGFRTSGVSMWKLESDIINLVAKRIEEERSKIKDVDRDQYTSELDRLERRIAKLSTVLGRTERELANVVQQKNIDTGVASLWLDVGLSQNDDQFERKTELLGAIFDANLKLQADE